MINLRRPTEAKIQPGQIKEEHLADGAINLENSKVTGSLPNSKLGRINDIAKLKDDLITLAKVKDDVKLNTFTGGEVEQSVTGIIEEGIVETGFFKIPGKLEPKKIRFIASLKVEGQSGDIAYLKVYMDDEVSPRLTLQSTGTVYDLVDGEFDVSDLIGKRHKIVIKANTSDVNAICWNDFIDILFIR